MGPGWFPRACRGVPGRVAAASCRGAPQGPGTQGRYRDGRCVYNPTAMWWSRRDQGHGRALASLLGWLAAGLTLACSAGDESLPVYPVVAGEFEGAYIPPLPTEVAPVVAWVFVTTDCPLANAYMPEVQSIAADFRAQGVRVLLVHVDPGTSPELAALHAEQYGLRVPVVLDPTHRLVRHAGASHTPEAAVFDSTGALRYLGRVDDRFPTLEARRAPSTTELRDALSAVLSGGPVMAPRVAAVGCVIEGLEP